MKYDVFISYSRLDSVVADRICAAFDKVGISYFIDRQDLSGGFEFPAVLAEAILESHIILFLASKNSYESKFAIAELTFAFNEKPKNSILPYIIDNTSMPPALRLVFSSINWRTIKTHPIETSLVDDILNMLGRDKCVTEEQNDGISTMSILSSEYTELKKGFDKRRKIVNVVEVIMLVAFAAAGLLCLFMSFISENKEVFGALTALSYVGCVGTYRLMKNQKDSLFWLIPLVTLGSFVSVLGSFISILLIIISLIIIALLSCVKKDGKSVWNLLEKNSKPIKDDFIYFLMIVVLIIGCLGLIPIFIAIYM